MELEGTQKDVPRRDFLWHAGRFFQTSGDALGNAFVESGKAFSTGFNTSSRAIATFSEGVVTELGQSMANAFTGVDSDQRDEAVPNEDVADDSPETDANVDGASCAAEGELPMEAATDGDAYAAPEAADGAATAEDKVLASAVITGDAEPAVPMPFAASEPPCHPTRSPSRTGSVTLLGLGALLIAVVAAALAMGSQMRSLPEPFAIAARALTELVSPAQPIPEPPSYGSLLYQMVLDTFPLLSS